jgi:hypothetical protein
LADLTAIAIGVFMTVLGLNAWHNLPPDLAEIAQAAVSWKAIFLTVSGAVMSVAGALRAFIRVRGDNQ